MAQSIEPTDLPEEIKPDFISHESDYDFPLYLSEKKEWKNFDRVKGTVRVSEPFLIMELQRFVPYLENKNVKFHILNMPNVKIGKIEIVGFVISTRADARYFKHEIDDGSGIITVYNEIKYFMETSQMRKKIDQKYRNLARNVDIKGLPNQNCPSKFPDPRPEFVYPAGTSIRDMAILEHNWALETNNGLFGKEVMRGDYIHVKGYCSLDFMFSKRPETEVTFDYLNSTQLTFFATNVSRIDEYEYNAKLNLWLNTFVRKRYDEHPHTSDVCLKSKYLKVTEKR